MTSTAAPTTSRSEYDDGDLDTLDLRDYTINRERYGFNGAMDYQFAPGSSWILRGVLNRFSDQEYRRAITQAISDNEVEWELKDRLETQTIGAVSLTGQHLLSTGAIVDFQASWAVRRGRRTERVLHGVSSGGRGIRSKRLHRCDRS